MRSIVLVALAGAALLSGCGNLAQMEAEARARQHAADESQCASFGYKAGSDAFADCMMVTQHRREQQQADARRQAEQDRQHQRDLQAQKAAADAAADARHQADVQNMMRSNQTPGVTPPMPTVPGGSHCTTTTTAQQAGNAGSSTSTTVCH